MADESTTKKDVLLTRVNKAVEKLLVQKNEKFRGSVANALDEETVIAFCVQTVAQRLTQRRRGKQERELFKVLKRDHPELLLLKK